MKAFILYIAIFALALMTIPMIALNYEVEIPDSAGGVEVHTPSLPEAAVPTALTGAATAVLSDDAADERGREPLDVETTENGVRAFRILDESTGQVVEVSLRDYVRGAVAAEMPASFHSEALKAQAVAAHTYALHNHLVQQESPELDLKGADFSADPGAWKVYLTEDSLEELYGDKADIYWKKICDAADEVLEYVLEYEDEPIVAAYHAISSGVTEDAANVWSGSAPYLKPVLSEGDALAPNYASSVTIGAVEMREILEDAFPEIALQEDHNRWFENPVHSPSGYVLQMDVGNITVAGKDLRTLLDLRSNCFTVEYSDAGFTFTVSGYGHGVGLSQYGADYLARQGYSFDEILSTYYQGAELKRVKLDPDDK